MGDTFEVLLNSFQKFAEFQWFLASRLRPVTPMRLSKLRTGHGIRQKFLLGLTTVLTLSEPFDVVKTFTYRPEYFGKPFCDLGHDLLRGPSEWTVGERELFGAFTASLNQCLF